MELYTRDRHYKSKSAVTVFPSKSFKVSSETTDRMHLTPGSLKFVDGLYLNIGPYSNDAFNVKKHNHRHHKNSRTHHAPYHLPLIVPNKITHNKHKQYKSQNLPSIRLPKDYKSPPKIQKNSKSRHKNTRNRRYRVPTNTPYHTPQKSHITHHKQTEKQKQKQKQTQKQKHKQKQIQIQKYDKKKKKKRYPNTNNKHLRITHSNSSLRVNTESPSTSIDNNMERESSNCSDCSNHVPTIGIVDLELIRKKRQKRIAKQRRIKIKEIKEVSSSPSSSNTSSGLSNNTHCSLRILCSVSSISTLSHFHKYGDIESLGVAICYIPSFEVYFGSNIKQLGHGGQGSIYLIDDDNVIKSYEMGSLGLYREIFALNNILGKRIQVYIERKTENKQAFIKFPLIRGENLMEYAQDLINNKKTSLRECHLQALFGQLFVSLFYLHSRGLVHRDIKIENVMVRESGEIEFIDFGHAIYIGHDLNEDSNFKLKWTKGNTEIFGTDCVLSPELKYAFYDLEDSQYIEYGTEIDFYSIGIMAVEIIYNIFDHSYQHSKWIQLLQSDIASNAQRSRLSLKCLNFIYGLIHTNPKKRLKMHEILNHPFLTEEVHDKLGYDNWYSDDDDDDDDEDIDEDEDIDIDIDIDIDVEMDMDIDIQCDHTPDLPPDHVDAHEHIPFIDDIEASVMDAYDLPLSIHHNTRNTRNTRNITMNMNDFECIVKQELVKHKITLICNALMDNALSYHPRIQHLNRLIVIIKECVAEKDTVYPDIAPFILNEFENAFNFQLRNYPNHSKAKCTSNIHCDKINKKTLGLHKKLYCVITQFTSIYKKEFMTSLDKYMRIMLDFNGMQHQVHEHFIGCMHRIIRVYSFTYDSFLIILETINISISQRNNSIKMKQLCISFVDFILIQYLKKKDIADIKLINNPQILDVIESIIKYGFNHSWTRTESQALLKTFTLLDQKMDKMNINKQKSLEIPTYAPVCAPRGRYTSYCVTPQVQVSESSRKRKKRRNHVKKNKSMDHMDIQYKKYQKYQIEKYNTSNKQRKIRKPQARNRNKSKSNHNSLHYISFAYPPPHHNKDGFVLESTSEIHHFDDICAAANDDDVPF